LRTGLPLSRPGKANDAAGGAHGEDHAPPRPTALRCYTVVSVRAFKRLSPAIKSYAVFVDAEKFRDPKKNSRRVT